MCVCVCHQKAVEEDVDEDSEAANDEVNEVVEELKVQHHGFVAACKGSSVTHKTYQEDDFIAHLGEETGHVKNPEGSGTVDNFTGVRPKPVVSVASCQKPGETCISKHFFLTGVFPESQ